MFRIRFFLIFFVVFLLGLIPDCKKVEKTSSENIAQEKPLEQIVLDAIQKGAIVIDVRTPQEFQMGHYKDAMNIPYDQIEQHIKELEPYKDKTILLYCRSGRRAGIAKNILESHGFKKIINAINLSYFPSESLVQ